MPTGVMVTNPTFQYFLYKKYKLNLEAYFYTTQRTKILYWAYMTSALLDIYESAPSISD